MVLSGYYRCKSLAIVFGVHSAGRIHRTEMIPCEWAFLVGGMMAHHRCTRCKQESYPRYKYKRSGVAGVYCDSCISWVRGFRPHIDAGWLGSMRSIWGSIWDRITDFASSVFQHKSIKGVRIAEERASYFRLKGAMSMRAKSIPFNPATSIPQKQ